MPRFSTDILRNRNFRVLALTRMLVTMALQAQAVIIGWQVYSITKDTLILGLTGLTEAIPAIACALFAGYFVDISQPRHVYRLCVGALMINTLLLLLIGGGYVAVQAPHILMMLFLGIFVSGLARAFLMPASFSLLSQIVPRNAMPSASAWMSTGFQIANIGGPALAGLLYGGYGVHGAWLMPAALMVLAFGCITVLQVPHWQRAEIREPAMQSIKAGWSFILQNPVLLSVMMLDMFAVLFGGAVAMLPAYADQVLHLGAQGLGILRAAPAAGAVITAIILALIPMQRISATRMLWVVAGFGCCIIGFGLSKYFWLSFLFLALSGVFDSVSVVIRGTLMQLLTPNEFRGRVSSVNSMFIISSNEIGAFESGFAAKIFGLVPSVVIGGCATLVIVAATALGSPKFRRTVVDADVANEEL